MKPETATHVSPMKSKNSMMRVASLLLLALLAAGQVAYAQTLLVQLKSTNYNASTGVWTDSSGNSNNATATGTKPALTAGASPNGSPAVTFSGSNPMGLASSLPVSSYTVLAYVKPGSGGGTYALLGGASGSFEYRINAGKQDDLRQQQADLGSETTAMSTSAFNVIDTILTSTGISFRLNGAADGTNAASSALTQPISAIGTRSSSSPAENFSGSICEIDIYSGVLTPSQITTVEASFTNQYITIPLTAPLLVADTTASPSTATVGGNDTLSATFTGAQPISYQWMVSPNSNGSGATSLTGQTNTTLVLTNLQLSNSGQYYSVVATNNVAPYITNSSWLQLNVVALTPLVQLQATNFNPSSGVWTDTSGNGNNATYYGTLPTLVSFATPNGSSAVSLNAGNSNNNGFTLVSSLSPSSGYTVFAYINPTNTSARHAITGGSASTALEYDVYNGKMNYLNEYSGTEQATGTGTIYTTNFSLVDVAVNSSGVSFRLNGAADGTAGGATFGNPITRIGNNEGGGDGYAGNIAEIDIYSGALTFTQITNIEAQLTAKYVTANSVVVGAATTSPTNNTYAGNPITISAPVLGATSTTAYQWQTDNGSIGASFSNISGANTTNYFVLNTTSLNGPYEYQLIVTPFGGTAVTSAPVTLTVQPASAPVVLVDATPVTATVGGNATFSAAFVGTLPIGGYQWQVSPNSDGSAAVNIAGATNTTLVLSNLQLANSGNYYSLKATNAVAPYVANSSWAQLTVQPLTALVQLIATNYNPGNGVWADSSGNNNNASYTGGSSPALASFVTPNGGSAVNITSGSGSFLLTSSLDPSSGYTVFAYLMPTNKSGPQALTGGSASGALEYSVKNDKQHYAVEYVADIGDGATNVSTNSFSLVDLAVNSSGGAFRYNRSTDGTNVAGSTFTSPITRIGNNEGNGDGFVGQIAEIDIYSGVLSTLQISNIEAQLTTNYVTANSVTVEPANATPTNNTYAGNSITIGAPVLGATSTTTYQWQTDNGSSGASFSNISGANTTNYFVLNTTSLNGPYEYQLIVTPFGGTAVTSAPVTLTVQPASAPVVLMDTTPNPATATVGGNLSFSASFTGTLPISGYQWQVSPNSDGSAAVNIAGATNTTLVLSNLQLANSGNYYSLQATNAIAPYVANSSWAQLTVQPLTALVQLIATNYNPITGVWTDYSGNNNNATYGVVQSGSLVLPSLVSSVTPNGSSAVNITAGNGSFVLTTPLDASSGYTVFAYIEPSSTSGRNAITGGSAQYALEYDVYNGNQNYLNEYSGTEQASGTGTIPTSNYSLIDLAASSSGVSFRLNAASDGTSSGATFSQPITRIGNNEGGGDGLVGQVAEIDIYNGALSSIQITNIEAQLIASYGTAGIPPVVTGLQFTAKPVISGTSLTISATNTGAGSIYLLTSTNIALPLSSWTPIWTNSTSGSGSFTTNLLNTVNPALGRQFYILGSTN